MSPTSYARRISAAFFAFIVASIITTSVARAALLVPASAVLTPAEPDPVGGAILAGGIPIPFTGPGLFGFSGTLTSTVIVGDVTNPFGAGALTFTYLLHNNAASATAMERITMADFTGFLTDVSYQPAGGTTAPTQTDRSIGAGGLVGWDFTGGSGGLGTLLPGATSSLLVIQTNAPAYDLTQAANVIDGSIVAVPAIGPALNIIQPEPGSLSLLALGAFGLSRVVRRK